MLRTRLRPSFLSALLAGTVLVPAGSWAQAPIINDLGGVGLMQTPTARMGTDGTFSGGVSHVSPYTRYHIAVQGLPWLEGVFRYTSIGNRLYSPYPDFSGDQDYKDRGVDLKLRLLQESDSWPDLAVGLRDIGGTGLFSSEYIVANKAFGPLDFSFGLAWGNLGSRGVVSNPLRVLSHRFDQRNSGGAAGDFNMDFFQGKSIGLFGGLAYETPIDGLSLLIEYDGNDYKSEPLGNRFKVDSPVNVGLNYKPFDWLQTTAAVERGNRFMLHVSLTGDFSAKSSMPKFDPPAPVPMVRDAAWTAPQPAEREAGASTRGHARAEAPFVLRDALRQAAGSYGLTVVGIEEESTRTVVRVTGSPLLDEAIVAQRLKDVLPAGTPDAGRALTVIFLTPTGPQLSVTLDATPVDMGGEAPRPLAPQPGADDIGRKLVKELSTQGVQLQQASFQGRKATLYVQQNRYRSLARAFGRVTRTAAAVLPPSYEEIEVVFVERSIDVMRVSLLRTHLESVLQPDDPRSVEELWAKTAVSPPPADRPAADFLNDEFYPRFDWTLRPRLQQSVGRPESFFLYQLSAAASAELQIGPHLTFSGTVARSLVGNFDKMRNGSDSVLPHVRSDIKEYLQQGKTALVSLQAEYATNIAPDVYGRVYGGLLEEMFGGVGGEVLYRPFGSSWAVGADLNWVKQRDYDQRFSFRDYSTTTGHVSGYYLFEPLGVLGVLRVGRYLAKDVGATVEMSRTFDSGVTVGVFATKTDVSAEKFGEGSFDKGFYISVPLDSLLLRSSRGSASWVYRPLTRDGGQRLGVRRPLYESTSQTTSQRLMSSWPSVLD
ncbi:YjbH domain-containing protein [Oleisolibacter albus]|uniref:YjbH domain-containing protein n=1 Tax=Oleisolibacter albus TaxID=2171757 RepID=UPI000DF114EB|nr:YjbH domain-containing protein [Oleisolibacter albus]